MIDENLRDCEHGQLRRSCERCADAREIADLCAQLADEQRHADELAAVLLAVSAVWIPLDRPIPNVRDALAAHRARRGGRA